MITEDYVSFETAKLLKEKGFDESISMIYTSYGALRELDRYVRNSYYNDITKNYFQYTAPTLQMVEKWLRKVYNLVIATSVTVDGWSSYVSQIKLDSEGFVVDIIDGIDGGNIPNCDTYEKSREAAIKYCLINLI